MTDRHILTNENDALQQLARGLENYVMNNRDGDAFDLAVLIDNLIKERMTPHEPIKQLCDGATPVRASTAEVVLPNTAESTASPVHPSQGYCGNWPCRLPNYHTGPCNSSPSQRT